MCLTFFILCVMNVFASAIVVPFQDCGSTNIKVTELNFDCEGNKPEPCTFLKGKTYHGNFSIKTTAEVSKGIIVLHAFIGGVKLPFPIEHPNICSDHGLSCPIPSGAEQVMTISLKVPSFAPTTNLEAQIEVKPSTTASTDDMCIKIIAQIISSNDITI